MASTKEYLDFVLEQLSGLDEISKAELDSKVEAFIEIEQEKSCEEWILLP